MGPANDEPMSAQVVIKKEMPSALAAAREEFVRAGFTVGPFVGTSFSIASSRDLFERYFDVRIAPTAGADSLPVERLPENARQAVEAILFTKPPDFGPTSFG